MSDLSKLEPGATVCVTGVGIDNMVHRHNIVRRTTKTLLVTVNSRNGTTVERFRLDGGNSVPYSSYGGTTAHIGCQKKGQVHRAG